MSVVAGHGLINEGDGYPPGYPSEVYLRRYWTMPHALSGVGVCRCGAISEPLPSNAARKRWHREHKAAISDLSCVPPKAAAK